MTTIVKFTCGTNDAVNGMQVALVQAEEQISGLFRIVVDAVTVSAVDPSTAIGDAANVSVTTDGAASRLFDGLISEVVLMGKLIDGMWFRFILVPPLATLGMTRRSRCFLTVASASARTAKDILNTTLSTAIGTGASPMTAEFNLGTANYPNLPSALQVDETDLDFMRRTAEAAGMGWYFKLASGAKTICFADTFTSYPWTDSTKADSAASWPNQITSMRLSKRRVTQQAKLNAWDSNAPATDLTCSSPTTLDVKNPYMEQFEQPYTSATTGAWLAVVRKEELTTGATTMTGTSILQKFAPGYVFTYDMSDTDFSMVKPDSFLLTEVYHLLWQSTPSSDQIMAAYKKDHPDSSDILTRDANGYGNRFVAVAQSAGYRPAQVTPKPRIAGLLRATLCDNMGATAGSSSTSPATPYMDSKGRYQVILPYPATDGKAGCLFAPLRIMGGFGGSLEVWQMPLRIGTTVYLAFEGGDIDRPIIAGVVANANQPTALPNTVQATGVTSTYLQSVLKTSSGIVVKITDGTPLVVAATSSSNA